MTPPKIVIVGAGSLQFGFGICGSILHSKILDGATVGLHDIHEQHLEYVREACQQKIDKEKLNFMLEASTNRSDVLKNADFIINTIEVGPRFYWWDKDWKIPLKYGSTQVFGENGGPGGMFHALRVIPQILDICEDINKICPQATLINYTNPMHRICLAVKRKYPQIKTVGLCHEIAFAEEHLPKILKLPFEKMDLWCGGLNHFGSVIKARNIETNEDLIPKIKLKGLPYFQKWRRSLVSRLLSPVDLTSVILEQFGYMPYTNDSHLGEYIGWARDVANMKGIKNFYNLYRFYINFNGKRIQRKIQRNNAYKLVKQDPERAVPIIEGIVSDSNHHELSVNLPNTKIIPNLPEDLVIECPAIVNKEGVQGIPLGENYPEPLVDLLKAEAAVQDLNIKTILHKSRDYAKQTLQMDSNFPRKHQADNFLDEMLEIQKEWVKLE
ncbi:MAG: alpha-glucosidase [Asgard group archaeon]|nr:alpha-glucosidase [Asgard group archaeon]